MNLPSSLIRKIKKRSTLTKENLDDIGDMLYAWYHLMRKKLSTDTNDIDQLIDRCMNTSSISWMANFGPTFELVENLIRNHDNVFENLFKKTRSQIQCTGWVKYVTILSIVIQNVKLYNICINNFPQIIDDIDDRKITILTSLSSNIEKLYEGEGRLGTVVRNPFPINYAFDLRTKDQIKNVFERGRVEDDITIEYFIHALDRTPYAIVEEIINYRDDIITLINENFEKLKQSKHILWFILKKYLTEYKSKDIIEAIIYHSSKLVEKIDNLVQEGLIIVPDLQTYHKLLHSHQKIVEKYVPCDNAAIDGIYMGYILTNSMNILKSSVNNIPFTNLRLYEEVGVYINICTNINVSKEHMTKLLDVVNIMSS